MHHENPPQRRVVIAFDTARRASARRGPVVQPASFPIAAGIMLGLGLGGLFDSVVLHRLVQWNRLLTSGSHPAAALEPLIDGVFEFAAVAFVAIGLARLWRAARSVHARWPHRLLAGTLLIGFGVFAAVETIVERPLFRMPPAAGSSAQWIGWAFLASSVALAIGGWALYRSGRASSERQARPAAAASRQAAWRRH